ncbi:MAG: hypothetical protein ABJK20_04400 [Halieaceae bacterium]
MSLGSWDPDADAAAQNAAIVPETIDKLVAFSRNEQLGELETLLDASESQTLSGLMKVDHALWQKASEPMSDDDILHLLRFFAVAENLPGWEAGADSPVIPLARTLRGRGQRLDKDLLRWLREVSENRYLPYGPL